MLIEIKSFYLKHYSWLFSGAGVVAAVAIFTFFSSNNNEDVLSPNVIAIQGDNHVEINGNSNTVNSIKIESNERKNLKNIFEIYSISFQNIRDCFCRESQPEEVAREILYINPSDKSKWEELVLVYNKQKNLGQEPDLVKHFINKKNFRPSALQNENDLFRIVEYTDLNFPPKDAEELRVILNRIFIFPIKLAEYDRNERGMIDHIQQYCSDLKRAKDIFDGF